MLEIDNYWFASYKLYYKEKFKIIESTYNSCLFYRSDILEIVRMQTNNTLILANNIFASKKKEVIKAIKIITKNCKYLTFA